MRGSPSSDASRARALYDHGYLVFWAGRYDLAKRRFAESFALAEKLADASLLALALAGLARVAVNTDVDEAVRMLRRAVDVTEGFAKADYERAATLIGMAAAMLERAGAEWPPDERQQYVGTLAAVTSGLPPERVATARARGAAISLTDGVAYALRAVTERSTFTPAPCGSRSERATNSPG